MYDHGDGAVGGGRWMKVRSPSSFVYVASGLLMSGSGAR